MGSAETSHIIDNYLQVLRTVGDLLAFGVPESLLAHEREEIRRAFRDCVKPTDTGTPNTGVNLGDLRTAYLSLASFLPYEEANAAARLQHAIERGDYAFLSSAAAEAATGISRRIEQEAARLAREFDALLGESTDPLLAEVEALLSQFERKQKSLAG